MKTIRRKRSKLRFEKEHPDLYDDLPKVIWRAAISVGQVVYTDGMSYKEWTPLIEKRLGEGVRVFLRRIWMNLDRTPQLIFAFPKDQKTR